ncbi:hypothetical protein TNCV_3848631 [Trichonephila clavipes]|uniref:Uncharacterized protein n=1 Tax=Trichonephila clavipes TaxID=2585209 RepID=A0A8X6V0I1_TRICX|nr:hypothetical protein TNCV_3848631 [Trichonephila clavipes]
MLGVVSQHQHVRAKNNSCRADVLFPGRLSRILMGRSLRFAAVVWAVRVPYVMWGVGVGQGRCGARRRILIGSRRKRWRKMEAGGDHLQSLRRSGRGEGMCSNLLPRREEGGGLSKNDPLGESRPEKWVAFCGSSTEGIALEGDLIRMLMLEEQSFVTRWDLKLITSDM